MVLRLFECCKETCVVKRGVGTLVIRQLSIPKCVIQ